LADSDPYCSHIEKGLAQWLSLLLSEFIRFPAGRPSRLAKDALNLQAYFAKLRIDVFMKKKTGKSSSIDQTAYSYTWAQPYMARASSAWLNTWRIAAKLWN
jgi:hypothetical protein